MTWQMALVFALLIGAILGFMREKTPPDILALALLVIIAATGLVPTRDVLSVFSNPAPITIAAMFVLSAALVRCGVLDSFSFLIDKAAILPYRLVLFLLMMLCGFASAWINNTPVVVVLVPVVLNLARQMDPNSSSRFPTPQCWAVCRR